MTENATVVTIATKLEGIKLFNVNGTQYLGKKEVKEGVINITEASECSTGSLKGDIITWIKKDNLKELDTLALEGEFQIITKQLSEKQKFEIEVIAKTADLNMGAALSELQNAALASL